MLGHAGHLPIWVEAKPRGSAVDEGRSWRHELGKGKEVERGVDGRAPVVSLYVSG